MTDHLYLISEDLPRLEKAVEGRVEASRGREVEYAIEAILTLRLYLLRRRVIVSSGLIRVPALVIVGT